MKILIILLLLSLNSFSHEGDEEVTAQFAPRYGGRVSAVVIEEDHNKMGKDHHEKGESKDHKDEHHDEPKYMSEIIISDANKVRLYFYDLNMKQIDLAGFPSQIKGSIKIKSQPGRGESIVLTKNAKNFMGDIIAVKKKPYDLEFHFILKKDSLHINFKAMD